MDSRLDKRSRRLLLLVNLAFLKRQIHQSDRQRKNKTDMSNHCLLPLVLSQLGRLGRAFPIRGRMVEDKAG